jgi:hypothetical protein
MMFVLELNFIVDDCVDFTAFVIEIKLQIVVGAHKL